MRGIIIIIQSFNIICGISVAIVWNFIFKIKITVNVIMIIICLNSRSNWLTSSSSSGGLHYSCGGYATRTICCDAVCSRLMFILWVIWITSSCTFYGVFFWNKPMYVTILQAIVLQGVPLIFCIFKVQEKVVTVDWSQNHLVTLFLTLANFVLSVQMVW